MAQSLRSQLLHGVVWNFVEKVLKRGTAFIIGIILARLLSPSDFGLVGMLAIFVTISSVFIESGLAKALIQRKNCKDIDFSTVFVTNLGISIVIYGLLFLSAPLIADFYDEPILTPLTRILGLDFILGSINIVQRARLMANMDFKSLAQINVTSTIVSGLVGVLMAYTGFGVWALVGQSLCATLVLIVLFPIYSKWRPSIKFSKESFGYLFGFGSKLLITNIFSAIVNNISSLCIGRMYKSSQLGYYTRALQFPEIVAYTMFDMLGNVTFPVLSGLQDERERLVAVYRKCLFVTAMVIIPVMVLGALLARPLVYILLTEKWLPCVVLMQWLFLARMFFPISAINMNILNAIGRSDLYMKLDFSKTPIDIVILAITIPLGVKAIAIGCFVNSFICFFINAYLPGRLFGYGSLQQLWDWRNIILSVIIMTIAVLPILFLIKNVWLQLVLGCMIGGGVYLICCFAFKVIDKDVLFFLKNRKL